MSLRLVVRPLAEQDLVETQRSYEEQPPGGGKRAPSDRLDRGEAILFQGTKGIWLFTTNRLTQLLKGAALPQLTLAMPRSTKRKCLTFEQVKATFAEFQDESDRAAAILSVSLLDVQLEEILTAFAADKSTVAEILKPNQPIGALGARRRLCLALGLISPDEAIELSILEKIRNKFAHELHRLDFNVDPIAGLVASLQVPQRVFPRLRFKEKRLRFMTSVAFMNLLLSWRFQAARTAEQTLAAKADIPLQPISKEDFERMST